MICNTQKIHLLWIKNKKKVQCSYTFAEKAEKINAPFCGAERSKGFRSLFPCFLQSLDLKRKLRKHSAFKIMLRPTARLMALPLQYVFRFESWQIACTWPWDSSNWLTPATVLCLLSQSRSQPALQPAGGQAPPETQGTYSRSLLGTGPLEGTSPANKLG